MSKEEYLARPYAKKIKAKGEDPSKGFAERDKDESGDLTFEELNAKPESQSDVDFFNALDSDGNGKLSKEEYLARPYAKKLKAKGEDPLIGFAEKDKDGSGDLSLEEL